MGLSGVHTPPRQQNRTQRFTRANRGCLRRSCTGADSAIENGRSLFVGCCSVKHDSLPVSLDAAIPFHEQRHFGTATTLGLRREPLKRCSQMSGRSICMAGGCVRGRSREPSGHRRTHCASMSRGDAVPRERAAPLLVPVPHRRASRFAIAASKCRGELSTIFTHPAARTVLPVPDAAPLCCPAL